MQSKQPLFKNIEPDDDLIFVASEEAKICLNCTEKKCNGDCKKFHEERRKLKHGKNKNS